MFTAAVSPPANKQTFTGVMQPQSPAAAFGGGVMSPISPAPSSAGSRSGLASPAMAKPQQGAAKASVGFDDLWNMSLGTSSNKATGGAAGSKSMKDLEKEKAQSGIWGASTGGGAPSSLFDMGSTTNSGGAGAGSGGASNDLLL